MGDNPPRRAFKILTATVFLTVIYAEDLMVAYGLTGETYPYVSAYPVIGSVLFLILSLGLTLWNRHDTAGGFETLLTTGFILWTVVLAVFKASQGRPIVAAVTALVGAAIAIDVIIRGQKRFRRPEELPDIRWWPQLVLTGHIGGFVLIVLTFLGEVSIEFAVVALTCYVISTALHPLALFVDATRGEGSWRYPVLMGCLGIVSLFSLGITGVAVTTIHKGYTTATS